MTATADHMRGLWGYNPPSAGPFNIAGRQKALRLGRKFPGYTLTPYSGFFGFPVTVRPYALPLPTGWTADQWGVPFDSENDVVVIVGTQGLLDPVTLPYNEAFEEFWYQAMVDGSASIYMVPATLPGDYDAIGQVLWLSEYAYEFGMSGDPKFYNELGFGSIGALLPTNNWAPYPLPYLGDSSSPFALSSWALTSLAAPIPYTGADAHVTYYNGFGYGSPGFRTVQIRFYTDTAYLTAGSTVTIELSHNVDGSDPGGSSGDTVDYTNAMDVTSPGGGLAFDSGWIDIGPIYPTLGVPSVYHAKLSTAGIARNILNLNNTANNYLEFRLSPRLDIPWPTTVLGQGSIIAPGGLLP